MSSMPDRLYKVAIAYLDAARGRLADIDSAAQEELRRAMPRENPDYRTASSDPMDRAAAKIDAARGASAARREIAPDRYNFSAPSDDEDILAPVQKTPTLVENAYQIVGVPMASPFPVVEKAVTKLRERCAPSRFPAGSAEQEEARRILARVEDAYRILQDALGVRQGRFDRLEL